MMNRKMKEKIRIINQMNHHIMEFEIYIQRRESDIIQAKDYIESVKDYIYYLKNDLVIPVCPECGKNDKVDECLTDTTQNICVECDYKF